MNGDSSTMTTLKGNCTNKLYTYTLMYQHHITHVLAGNITATDTLHIKYIEIMLFSTVYFSTVIMTRQMYSRAKKNAHSKVYGPGLYCTVL